MWVGTISDRNIPKYDKQNLLKRTCIFSGTGKKTTLSGCKTLSQTVNSSMIEGIKSLVYNNC